MTRRTTARVVGILFIVATVASVSAILILDPVLGDANYLTRVSADDSQVATGAIFEIINHLAVVGIAVAMYPILRQFSERAALGYVAVRTVESVLFFIATTQLLQLVTVSEDFVAAGSPSGSSHQTLADALLAGHDWDQAHLAFIAFTVGALLLNLVLYRTGLVPRWLSVAGFGAAAIHLVGAVAGLYGAEPSASAQLVFDMPILVQEMVFALWLIVKGFNPVMPLGQAEPVSTLRMARSERRREPAGPTPS